MILFNRLAAVLMIKRVYAIYGRHKCVLYGLTALVAIEIAIAAVSLSTPLAIASTSVLT